MNKLIALALLSTVDTGLAVVTALLSGPIALTITFLVLGVLLQLSLLSMVVVERQPIRSDA